MAIVKFINGRNEKIAGLIKAIDYVTDENKTEVLTLNGVKHGELEGFNQEDKESIFIEKLIIEDKGNRAINYITKDEKTSKHLITGINCSPETAFDEMMITKRMYNKEKGRQFIHFVHSFHEREKITPEIAHEISMKFIENEKFKGFQLLAATHTNEDHLHTHFVLNTVNVDTGKKWQLSTQGMKELIRYSNEICKEYGLKHSFPNIQDNSYKKYRLESKNTGEYRSRKKGRSWKHELWLTINECKKISSSKEEFIKNMNVLGYQVRWQDSRKNITFTLPNGRKCNNDKLHPPEKYTKEALLKRFELNKQFQEKDEVFRATERTENLQNMYLETIRMLSDNPELDGDKDYPLTYLEGQALKEKMIEEAKGRGLDWGRER